MLPSHEGVTCPVIEGQKCKQAASLPPSFLLARGKREKRRGYEKKRKGKKKRINIFQRSCYRWLLNDPSN